MMRDGGRYPELGEVVERLLRMSPRGAEKVTAEREDESRLDERDLQCRGLEPSADVSCRLQAVRGGSGLNDIWIAERTPLDDDDDD